MRKHCGFRKVSLRIGVRTDPGARGKLRSYVRGTDVPLGYPTAWNQAEVTEYQIRADAFIQCTFYMHKGDHESEHEAISSSALHGRFDTSYPPLTHLYAWPIVLIKQCNNSAMYAIACGDNSKLQCNFRTSLFHLIRPTLLLPIRTRRKWTQQETLLLLHRRRPRLLRLLLFRLDRGLNLGRRLDLSFGRRRC